MSPLQNCLKTDEEQTMPSMPLQPSDNTAAMFHLFRKLPAELKVMVCKIVMRGIPRPYYNSLHPERRPISATDEPQPTLAVTLYLSDTDAMKIMFKVCHTARYTASDALWENLPCLKASGAWCHEQPQDAMWLMIMWLMICA